MNWYKCASYDYKNQEILQDSLSDIMRYTFDSYSLNMSKNKTKDHITVSMVMSHSYLGSLIYNYFLSFDLDQEKEASSAFKEMTKITQNTMSEFVENEIPSNLLHSYLRKRYKVLGDDNIIKTNIPSINYSFDLEYEDDWRSQIYGKRYPKHKEISFRQNGRK